VLVVVCVLGLPSRGGCGGGGGGAHWSASENILQEFEFGAAQNRVSIKGLLGTSC
jgi:hypothetical protein